MDLFYADILEDNDKMHDLWTVVKMILTLILWKCSGWRRVFH